MIMYSYDYGRNLFIPVYVTLRVVSLYCDFDTSNTFILMEITFINHISNIVNY